MNKVTIYTNETCLHCKTLKEELTKNNIEFENKLTSEFSNEYEGVVNLTGIPTVPTVVCNDEYFLPGRDYQTPQQLVDVLKSFKNSSFNETKRTFERIKTLNYNINMAFGKLDQLLRKIETKINTDEHKSTN